MLAHLRGFTDNICQDQLLNVRFISVVSVCKENDYSDKIKEKVIFFSLETNRCFRSPLLESLISSDTILPESLTPSDRPRPWERAIRGGEVLIYYLSFIEFLRLKIHLACSDLAGSFAAEESPAAAAKKKAKRV
jgi:hypothetical protein